MTGDIRPLLAAIDKARLSPSVSPAQKVVNQALRDYLTGTTPPTPAAWAWDATKATVDPNSDALVKAFVAGAGLPAFLNAGNAAVTSTTADPGYAIIATNDELDPLIHIPAGTKPGCDDDGHLSILCDNGRETDLYKAQYDPVQGRWMAGGGGSFPAGAVQETIAGNSNAACFPLARGLLRPEDLLPGAKPHPLVISCNASLLGAPVRYPARGEPGPTGPLAFGMWLRFPPGLSLAGLPVLEATIVRFVQACGMFIRDGGSPVNICALDCINAGGNQARWASVGVTLTNTVGGYPYAQQLSTAIPWAKLQALVPPTP